MIYDYDYFSRLSDPDDRERQHNDSMKSAIASLIGMVVSIIIGLAICGLISLLTGCSPRIIEHNTVRTDTCYVQKFLRDSIYINDSIYVKEQVSGDTVIITTDRWHTRWRERIMRDTAYVSQRDTVIITKTQEVSKSLSSWQCFQIWAGRLALIAIALTLLILVFRLKNPLSR